MGRPIDSRLNDIGRTQANCNGECRRTNQILLNQTDAATAQLFVGISVTPMRHKNVIKLSATTWKKWADGTKVCFQSAIKTLFSLVSQQLKFGCLSTHEHWTHSHVILYIHAYCYNLFRPCPLLPLSPCTRQHASEWSGGAILAVQA